MIGAITGDIIGSIYERNNIKTKDFHLFGEHCTFTDDTVCTIAVADWLMNEGDLSDVLSGYVSRYPNAGYGSMFRQWAQQSDRVPYNSWGNGSAMRVSAVMYIARDEQEVLDLAEKSSAVTHNHPNAIAGVQATALTMWMAKNGADVQTIRRALQILISLSFQTWIKINRHSRECRNPNRNHSIFLKLGWTPDQVRGDNFFGGSTRAGL
jgi:ADP-ribosylglycohydrolase